MSQVRLIAAALALLGLPACARPSAYAIFSSEAQTFTITYPAGWQIARGEKDERVWFLPPGAPGGEAPHLTSSEFLLVFTVAQPGPLEDDEARRVGLRLLPIHGVSGFRRFRDNQGLRWHRFEVTGTSQASEWASVGLLVTGPSALRYVVCAKPLDRWRDGQKQCDGILTTFIPGRL
ncbi:MAG: hypothetical protein HY334_04815 [Armatimonadetes bacterium]|nr:hypothetical protein [Armatimonadota bacterium]